jgi:hypothetical protein
MSPAESLNTLPTVPLAYFDNTGSTGTVTFTASPQTVTFTFTSTPTSPLAFNVTPNGGSFTGSNSVASLRITVLTATSCVGYLEWNASPGVVVQFGARICPMPASALPFEGTGTNPYKGNITFTPTQITVTDSSGGNYAFAMVSITIGAQIVFAAEMISGSGPVVLRGVLYSPTTGIFAIGPATNENPPGGSYTTGAGGYLPIPALSLFIDANIGSSGSITVDINSHLWFSDTSGNLYGPLFVPLNFLGGYQIGNVGFGGTLPVGGKNYTQMTGSLNMSGGAGTLIGAVSVKDSNSSWRAGGSGRKPHEEEHHRHDTEKE